MAHTKLTFRHKLGWLRLWIVASLLWICGVIVDETASPLQIEQVFNADVAAAQLEATNSAAREKAGVCYSAPAMVTTPSWPEAFEREKKARPYSTPIEWFLEARDLPPERYRVELSCATQQELWRRSTIGIGRALVPPVALPIIAGCLLWVLNWVKAGFSSPPGPADKTSDRVEAISVLSRTTGRPNATFPNSASAPRKRRTFNWYYYRFWNWVILPLGWFLVGLGVAWKATDHSLAASVVVAIAIAAIATIFRWGSMDDLIKNLD